MRLNGRAVKRMSKRLPLSSDRIASPNPVFVIEHLEPKVGKWLYFEYANASRIVGRDRLIFTNVKRKEDAKVLSDLGVVRRESFSEIFSPEKIIILDPKALERLRPGDFTDKEAVIVGGILGGNPPRGRTRKLVTSKAPSALSRNIGEGQFSIDGAVYVAKLVSEGVKLEDIPVKRGLHIRINDKFEIYLPYLYPLRDGKSIISDDLVNYLMSNEIVHDEEKILGE